MSDSGPSPSQSQGRYHNGVWLSNSEGARSEKYHKWTDERTRFTVETLDKQKHNSLFKLNCERLQIRTELRGLQQDRRHVSQDPRGHGSSEDPGGDAPLHHHHHQSQRPPSDSAATPGRDRLHKTHSSGSHTSPTSSSAGCSSLGSSSSASTSSLPPAFGRKGSGIFAARGKGEAGGKGVAAKVLSPEESAMKLRNFHSSRALSKLKNNMNVDN